MFQRLFSHQGKHYKVIREIPFINFNEHGMEKVPRQSSRSDDDNQRRLRQNTSNHTVHVKTEDE